MANPQYIMVNELLTVARTQARIVDVGVKIAGLIFHSVPGGSGVLLRFGNNGQDFPAESSPNQSVCPAADEGLFMTNPLGAGTFVLQVIIEDLTPAG